MDYRCRAKLFYRPPITVHRLPSHQNVDHSHHHKHPYIYAMLNDGTKPYIPDAEVRPPGSKWRHTATRRAPAAQDTRALRVRVAFILIRVRADERRRH